MMRTFALASLLLTLVAAEPWAQQAPGPAPVSRPLQAELPLPPIPPSATAPAPAISPSEALVPLPSAAELQAEAERVRQAARPPALTPVQVPQRIEPLGQGRFLILPRETPLQTEGTVSGVMFRDETETELPEPPQLPASEPVPSYADVRAEMEAVKSELGDLSRDIATLAGAAAAPASPTAPEVAVPSVTVPLAASPSVPRVAAPAAALPPVLKLSYNADAVAAPRAVKAWAAKYAAAGRLNLHVVAHTAAPAGDETTLAQTRWQAISHVLAGQGLRLGRVSFLYLKADVGRQGILLKPVR